MTRRLAHRGPDDSGTWVEGSAALGHRRLSVLDTSDAGHQPMRLGSLAIVFNGEIYNFKELRSELEGPFHSDSDTEVLLHLYARDGADMVHALRGMFAFAIWDEARHTLFAARDRLGIKPFFYQRTADGLAFASEPKALLELGNPEIDHSALWDVLTYGYVPFPKTMYEGIRQLPPAHRLSWDGELRTGRYWSPKVDESGVDADSAVARLDELLSVVVPEHTISDVPLGVLLSGGLDSSTITSCLDQPHTFTLGMDVEGYDEREAARLVASHFDTHHHESVVGLGDLEEAVETVPRLYDEPFGDSAAWSAFLVSRMARKHVTVVLSGEGGDELFLGYGVFGKALNPPPPGPYGLLAPLLPAFSSQGESLDRRAATGAAQYGSFYSPFTPRQKRTLFADLVPADYDDYWHFAEFWREDLEPLRRRQWMNLHTDLPGRLLTKVDRASMAHGLEARPPLLDHRLVEFALNVDTKMLRNPPDDRGKLLLRRLMKDRLPADLFELPKRGFDLPVRQWERKSPGLLDDAIARLARAGVIRARRPRLSSLQIWTLLVVDRWLQQVGGL